MVEAPRAHEMTRRYLHDCEYANINLIRAGMKEAAKLKKNLYSNRIPFRTADINAPPLLPTKEAAPRPDNGKGKAPLRASAHNADQGPPTRRKLEDRDRPGRIPLDHRLVQRNQSPSRNPPQNRYDDSDVTFDTGNCARDQPKDARDRHDSSFRDKSMSSDRSRDVRPREVEPSRNRDPRERDEQRYHSYSSLQRAPSPTRDRGAKGIGGKAPRLDSSFPKFCAAHIEILSRAKALRYLGMQKPLTPPMEAEAASISDYDLADLLRKPTLGQYDRANHEIICGQLRDMYSIGIEMTYAPGQTSVWLDIHGQIIPPEKVDEIPMKYYYPPEREKGILGNYWWVVRLRPLGGTKKYEYMINKKYYYSRLVFDFAQIKTLILSANR